MLLVPVFWIAYPYSTRKAVSLLFSLQNITKHPKRRVCETSKYLKNWSSVLRHRVPLQAFSRVLKTFWVTLRNTENTVVAQFLHHSNLGFYVSMRHWLLRVNYVWTETLHSKVIPSRWGVYRTDPLARNSYFVWGSMPYYRCCTPCRKNLKKQIAIYDFVNQCNNMSKRSVVPTDHDVLISCYNRTGMQFSRVFLI